MLFVDWSFWWELFVAAAVIATFVWLAKKSTNWKRARKFMLFFTGLPVVSLAALAILLALLETVEGCDSHGPPLYSPDHKVAARIETWDAGATGGGTTVRVFQSKGFDTKVVFSGNWESVDEKDLSWLDGHHLKIVFAHRLDRPQADLCTDAGDVHVTCIAQ